MRGFLVVDKPAGATSSQVVGRVRRATGIKKVGHAGTLDPMATGVLVLALGSVTRLIRYIQELPKEYLARARFGVATDTLDADGAILSREPMEFSPEELERVASRFVGTIHQVPPMVSALKHEGRRLYDLAREGQVVEREARPVVVHTLEIETVGPGPYPDVEFRVVCGKGTYVRSLADDMAKALGGSGHLTALRRTRIGSLTTEGALPADRLEEWEDHLLSPAQALSDLPRVEVGSEVAAGVRHGVRFLGGDMADAPGDDPYAVIGPGGEMLAVYRNEGSQARPEVVLGA